MANSKCQECGCTCKLCKQDQNDMHLYIEIENLRQRLVEQDSHIVTMENQFLKQANQFPNGELASLREEITTWQDKFTRLQEGHKRLQQINHNLEDKLLKIVDKCESEKGAFTKDVATLSHRLAEANYNVHRLTQDNEKYRNDVNLAIQLLQCNPSNFIGQKFELLTPELQVKVRNYVTPGTKGIEESNSEVRSITVPISTFPPTAMVYNVPKSTVDKQDCYSEEEAKPHIDIVPATVMAKILEDREKDRIFTQHCITCTCYRSVLKIDSETQTTLETENGNVNPKSKSCFNKLDLSEMVKKNTVKTDETSCVNIDYSNFEQKNLPNAHHLTNDLLTFDTKTSVDSKALNFSGKTLFNLKTPSKRRIGDSNIDEKNTTVKEVGEYDVQPEIKDTTQARIDMINERLWKSSWINSPDNSCVRSSSHTEINVINERVWKNSPNSGGNEPLAVQSGKIEQRVESVPNAGAIRAQSANIISSTIEPHRSPESLLEQQIPIYQTVLYTSGTSRPSAALVHVTKSNVHTVDDNKNESIDVQKPIVGTTVTQWTNDSLSATKLEETDNQPLLS